MYDSIGFVELNSIARGFEVSDHMLKAADVSLIFAKTTCPGKFVVLICGDVAAVKASVDVGEAIGKESVVDSILIPRVHEQVIFALNDSVEILNRNALGIVEYFSISQAIVGADRAIKTADVSLLVIRLGTGIGGKSFFVITGEISSVIQAINVTVEMAKESGMLIGSSVIPNPRSEIFEQLA